MFHCSCLVLSLHLYVDLHVLGKRGLFGRSSEAMEPLRPGHDSITDTRPGASQHAAVVLTWCSLLIGCGLWLPFTLGRYTLLAAAPLLPRAPPMALLQTLLGHAGHGAPAAAALAEAPLGNATQACVCPRVAAHLPAFGDQALG